MINTVVFQAPAPGPKLLFLGGVHGDENPGILALETLLEELKSGRVRLLRGSLTIAPRVNASAAKRGLHFIDENLNRIVRRHDEPLNHEQELANALIPLIDSADVVLDLHGAPAPSVPFAFLDDESSPNRAWADSLGVDYLLTGWPALYPGGKTVTTTEYAQGRGKRALTVEVGQNDDPKCAELGLGIALRSLAHFGLVIPVSPAPVPRPLRFTRVIYRERDGVFVNDWKNFDFVKKGAVLARYADGADVASPEDAFVVMPYAHSPVGGEWLYLAVPA